MSYLIIDIGGTFLKIYCSKTLNIIKCKLNEKNGIIKIRDIKKNIVNNIRPDTNKIFFTSQMHGFVLFNELGQNLTDFITWKKKSKSNILINSIFEDFENVTGLSKRDDLPINNIYDFLKTNKIKGKIFVKNITEALFGGKCSNITMSSSMGFYNVYTKQIINKYIDFFKNELNVELVFDNTTDNIEVSSNFNDIEVNTGIGDLQANVTGILEERDVLISMATGSQIITFLPESILDNKRIFFSNTILNCKTHIPCGRFFLKIKQVVEDLYKKESFWEDLKNVSLERFLDFEKGQNALPTFNINNFYNTETDYTYLIKHYNISYEHLLLIIINEFTLQYIDIINKLENKQKIKKIIITGGIGKKIPIFSKIIQNKTLLRTVIIDNPEDTINGMNILIKKYNL